MTGNEFHDRLDAYYAAGDAAGAYRFLRESRDGALAEDNQALLLTVDNALIGHCHCQIISHACTLKCQADVHTSGTVRKRLHHACQTSAWRE